jgi:hypothetical protein
MATTYKVLAQATPTTSRTGIAAASGDYVTPSSTNTVVSSITICNTTAAALTAYVYVVKSAGTSATSNALVYGSSVAANSTTTFTIGITLNTSEALVFGSSATGLTFQAYGSEIA